VIRPGVFQGFLLFAGGIICIVTICATFPGASPVFFMLDF
jgi:hypothetical protein